MTDGDPSVDGFSLADRSVPADPEALARSFGAAIRRRHDDESTATEGALSLAVVADVLVQAADAAGEPAMTSGPYLGRSTGALARVAAETVSVLPPATGATVAIRAGLRLDDGRLHTDGTVTIGGPFVRGDRELELAGAAVAMGERHGPAVVAPLFDAYGMELLDLRRLDTSQLLVALAYELGVDLHLAAR